MLDLQLASPFLHFFSSHYRYQEWCKEMHSDKDPYRCGIIYTYHKNHDDFDRIMDFDRTFFGYYDSSLSGKVLYGVRDAARYLLYAGLLLHLLQIRIPSSVLIGFMLVVNMVAYLPHLWMPFKRFGPDYRAYVAQAGQFASGCTNYVKISSVQGQCFYPAGHLYHYVPVYYLYLLTPHAEQFVKIAHHLMHTGTIYIVAKLA